MMNCICSLMLADNEERHEYNDETRKNSNNFIIWYFHLLSLLFIENISSIKDFVYGTVSKSKDHF